MILYSGYVTGLNAFFLAPSIQMATQYIFGIEFRKCIDFILPYIIIKLQERRLTYVYRAKN